MVGKRISPNPSFFISFVPFTVYECTIFILPNTIETLRLSFMESYRGECMNFNHLTSMKTLQLANVDSSVFDISQCISLETIDFKSVTCRSFVFPENIKKMTLTNIFSVNHLNLESLDQLTSIDLILSSFNTITYPSSLKELTIRQCNEYIFDVNLFNQLPNLKRFISRDVKFNMKLNRENYPMIDFYS